MYKTKPYIDVIMLLSTDICHSYFAFQNTLEANVIVPLWNDKTHWSNEKRPYFTIKAIKLFIFVIYHLI